MVRSQCSLTFVFGAMVLALPLWLGATSSAQAAERSPRGAQEEAVEHVQPRSESLSTEGTETADRVRSDHENALWERVRASDGQERDVYEAPELDPSSAGAAAVLLGGSALLVFDRRRRRAS